MTDSIINSEKKNKTLLSKKKRSFFNILKINNTSYQFNCHFENCNRSFKEKGNLKTHLRTHVINSKNRLEKDHLYVISKIAEKHSLQWEILNHIYVTILVKNLLFVVLKHVVKSIADFVDLRFISELMYLILIQTGEKPFICPNCKKGFNEKGNLKTHMRIHTGEKPYVCSYISCGLSFKAHGHLKDHMKRHLNLKPYGCTLCNSKFARSSTLKIHLNTHTGEKPYICPYQGCEKRFTEKGNMKTHLKIHVYLFKQRIVLKKYKLA